MKVLLILAFVVTTRAALLPPRFPIQSYFGGSPTFEYQNYRSTPCGSSTPSPLGINGGFISTSPATLGINSELISSGSLQGNEFGPIISSTPQPDFGLSGNLFSSTVSPNVNVKQEYFSSTPVPNLFLNQGLNSLNLQNFEAGQIGPSPFVSENGHYIDTNSLSNSFSQQIPQRLGDYSAVTIQSSTSGGSLNDAFGISEESFETQSQKPEITKNVYFFAAPEEPEPIRPRIYFEPNKKNVNLVFIKAPVQPSLGPIEITPPQQESAEKTIVYVLVKKPEQEQEILVKSGPVAKPRKPEVFFIKYKNEDEAQHTISKVQTAHVNVEDHQPAQELNESQELFNIDSAKNSLNKPLVNYLSDRTILEQPGRTFGFQSGLTPTESSFSTQSPELVHLTSSSIYGLNSNSGINNIPLVYSTPRPQVEINEISGDTVKDQYITIGGRHLSSELLDPVLTSNVSPLIVSSTVSPVTPCEASSGLPITISSTLRPNISALNPFLRKK